MILLETMIIRNDDIVKLIDTFFRLCMYNYSVILVYFQFIYKISQAFLFVWLRINLLFPANLLKM